VLTLSGAVRAVVISILLPRLRETLLVHPIFSTALAIRVIRANIVAQWPFELPPTRERAAKARNVL
jgi:hypothetical protein